MTTPVSIVITCYNLGAYLHEALDSALAQTYPDTEIVLIDDGSTDAATIRVLDALAPHPRLRVLRTANQGVARARNYGFSEARGEYVLPLDADDRILPEYVARAAAILDRDPRVGFVGCHYRIFGERSGACTPSSYAFPALLVENVVPVASLVRRRCWEEVGGYCAEVQFEDWDLWLGILGRGHTGAIIDELLFEYRVRPSSRQSDNQRTDVYVQTLARIYQRHQQLYTAYLFDVLSAKDRQFSQLHGHSLWLEQQASNWEREATLLRPSATAPARTMAWWEHQRARWRRIRAAEPSVRGRATLVAQGVARVAKRTIRQLRRSTSESPK